MSFRNSQKTIPYFELVCFVAAWAMSLSIAWTASHDRATSEPTARFASTAPFNAIDPSAR